MSRSRHVKVKSCQGQVMSRSSHVKVKSCQGQVMSRSSLNQRTLTITKTRPRPVATLWSLCRLGNMGSLAPVTGFTATKGAFAAYSALGLSSSPWKSVQSHWYAIVAHFLFQYSKNATAEMNSGLICLIIQAQSQQTQSGNPLVFSFLYLLSSFPPK